MQMLIIVMHIHTLKYTYTVSGPRGSANIFGTRSESVSGSQIGRHAHPGAQQMETVLVEGTYFRYHQHHHHHRYHYHYYYYYYYRHHYHYHYRYHYHYHYHYHHHYHYHYHIIIIIIIITIKASRSLRSFLRIMA